MEFTDILCILLGFLLSELFKAYFEEFIQSGLFKAYLEEYENKRSYTHIRERPDTKPPTKRVHSKTKKGDDYMNKKNTFEELKNKIEKWSKDRQIIPNSTSEAQLLKAFSEMGELADATIKKDEFEKIDAIGDVLVCLINYCALENIDIVDCLGVSYETIKNRKGTLLKNGVFVKEC